MVVVGGDSGGLTCQALPGNSELGFQPCSLGALSRRVSGPGPAGGAMRGKTHGFGPHRLVARLQRDPLFEGTHLLGGRTAWLPRAERNRLRETGRNGGCCSFRPPPLPYTSLPLLLQRGKNTHSKSRWGILEERRDFSVLHFARHESVRRDLQRGVYVCAGGRRGPRAVPAH